MAIQDFELFHGAVFTQLLRNDSPMTLRVVERSPESLWGEYLINGSVRLLIKYSKTPRQGQNDPITSWSFLLNQHEIKRLSTIDTPIQNWLALVCGCPDIRRDHPMQTCLLLPNDLGSILDGRLDDDSVSVTVRHEPGRRLVVFRGNIELVKVPASRIQTCQFPDPTCIGSESLVPRAEAGVATEGETAPESRPGGVGQILPHECKMGIRRSLAEFKDYPDFSLRAARKVLEKAALMAADESRAIDFTVLQWKGNPRGIAVNPNFIVIEYIYTGGDGGVKVSLYGLPQAYQEIAKHTAPTDGRPPYTRVAVKSEDQLRELLGFLQVAWQKKHGARPRGGGRPARVPPGFQAAPGTLPEPYTGTGRLCEIVHAATGMMMAKIPAGSFTMGSPTTEAGRDDDERQHRVTLTRGFYLGKYEVTHGQWKRLMGTDLRAQVRKALQDDTVYNFGNRTCTQREFWGKTKDADPRSLIGPEDDDVPMHYVSWTDAVEFCQRLTAQERAAGRLMAGYEFRLPTEAEWEHACRAGTSGMNWLGDFALVGTNNAPGLDAIAWYGGNSSVGYSGTGWDTAGWEAKQYPGGLAGPRGVGTRQANPLGLHDMLGNVYEWCHDWYGGYPSEAVTDPRGPQTGSHRVVRGGGWRGDAACCRAAYRGNSVPSYRNNYLGFRAALGPSF